MLKQIPDDVIADPEGARLQEPPYADNQSADARPPHPMQRQALKGILNPVEHVGHQRR